MFDSIFKFVEKMQNIIFDGSKEKIKVPRNT